MAAVERAESELGFALPALLRRLYVEVADGGFGPGFGLFGIQTPGTYNPYTFTRDLLVEMYRDMCRMVVTESGEPAWPRGMLPLCELGCCGFSCVDCTDPQAPIYVFGLDQDGRKMIEEGEGELERSEFEKLLLQKRESAREAPTGTRTFEFLPQRPSIDKWLEGWVEGEKLTLGINW